MRRLTRTSAIKRTLIIQRPPVRRLTQRGMRVSPENQRLGPPQPHIRAVSTSGGVNFTLFVRRQRSTLFEGVPLVGSYGLSTRETAVAVPHFE